MSDSPSARIVATENATRTVTATSGRKFTYRAKGLSVLDQAKLFKAIGPAQSENWPYVRTAVIAACITDIDGVPMPKIVNDAGVERAIELMDDDGFAALSLDFDARAKEAAEEIPADPLAQPAL